MKPARRSRAGEPTSSRGLSISYRRFAHIESDSIQVDCRHGLVSVSSGCQTFVRSTASRPKPRQALPRIVSYRRIKLMMTSTLGSRATKFPRTEGCLRLFYDPGRFRDQEDVLATRPRQ